VSEPRGPNAFVDAAYHLEDEASLVEFYRQWAKDYDHQMLDELGYVSPVRLCGLVERFLPARDAEILDVGCGTGLTCVPLAEAGYRQLDGIDLSPEMVRVAAERGIYRELLVGDLNQALERDDASYDGVVSTGTFTHGHVGPGPLDELLRILRPGGILACSVHQDLWESMGFRARFEDLVGQRRAECLALEHDSYYRDSPPEGWFCVYRKPS